MIHGKEHQFDRLKFDRQVEAARLYALHIAKPEIEMAFGKSIFAYFKDYQNQGYKLINVPAYIDPPLADTANRKWIPELDEIKHNIDFEVKGCLDDVNINEFKGKDKLDQIKNAYCIHTGSDGRVGHLSVCNHDVLVEKLYDSLVHKKDLDFTQGFKTNFITEENWHEHNHYGAKRSQERLDYFMKSVKRFSRAGNSAS